MRRLSIALLSIAIARGPASGVVLGGGLSDTDCTVGFEGVRATDGASAVVCQDGDPACDDDGVVDGSCRFVVRACAGLSSSGCEPRQISSIHVAGLALDAPRAAGDGMRCGVADTITVPVGTAAAATMIARDGSEPKDVDYLNLCCEAGPVPLGAVACGLAVDPSIAGCAAVPARFTAALARARAQLAQAMADPTQAKPALAHTARALRRMRAIARTRARSDLCGDALGLWVGETQNLLGAARR